MTNSHIFSSGTQNYGQVRVSVYPYIYIMYMPYTRITCIIEYVYYMKDNNILTSRANCKLTGTCTLAEPVLITLG